MENQTQKWRGGDVCTYTQTTIERRQMFYVENPNRENHGSPQTPKYHYMRGSTMRRHRCNNLVLPIFARWQLQQKLLEVSISLPICHNSLQQLQHQRIILTVIALGHIYTHVTLIGLFYKYSDNGLT